MFDDDRFGWREARRIAPPIPYSELPDGLDRAAYERQMDERLYTYLSKPLIDDLSHFLEGRNVVEAYAGRGHLSALLSERGVSIKPTSLRSGHDASASLGHVLHVENIGVIDAVKAYRDWMDVLLVAWPVADESLRRALPHLPEQACIVFIGEVTDYSTPFPFLGGCASDAFFEQVVELPEMSAMIRYPTYRQDKLKVYRVKESLLAQS